MKISVPFLGREKSVRRWRNAGAQKNRRWSNKRSSRDNRNIRRNYKQKNQYKRVRKGVK